MTRPTQEAKLAGSKRKDRDAWINHAKACEKCREKTGICDAGRPLLKAAIAEMGDGK